MHPVRILRPKTKSTFLTISIPVAGTNSVSSGNILDEFFFDKYFRPMLTESMPFNYMLKSKLSLSRHFEYANEQITYHFWLFESFRPQTSPAPVDPASVFHYY
jgi:hypothetical protein